MITHRRFELESLNLQQTYIMGYSLLVLKIRVIDLDLEVIRSFRLRIPRNGRMLYNVVLVYLGWPRGVTLPNVLLLVLPSFDIADLTCY